jgi:3-methyladenine DNA glycosylase AlkD
VDRRAVGDEEKKIVALSDQADQALFERSRHGNFGEIMRHSDMLERLREEFKRLGDRDRAEGARAYMKSEMPYHGVPATPMRKVCRAVFAETPLPTAAAWRKEVLRIWRNARYREERYAAIELTGFKMYRSFQDLDALPMYEEMIVDGAWWDYVDAIAIQRVGAFLLRDYPKFMKAEMRRWSRDDDMWKRRSSIIAQITFKNDTDLKLLYDCIHPSIESREFFLRKAIGWALRAYAWVDPREVKRYVRDHPQLSGLSKREALKNVGRGPRR